MRVRTDRRSREVEPAPEAEVAARRGFLRLARASVETALALAEVERKRSYVRSGYASAHAFARAQGLGPREANRLFSLGRALQAAPELVKPVRSGRVPVESALAVGRVLRERTLSLTPAARASWVAKAFGVAPRELRRQAEKAVEDARQGAPTLALTFQVTTQGRDAFQRSRRLMSRGQPRTLPEGEVLRRLSLSWLARHDPERRPLPARRRGPTAGSRCRYVPRAVVAQLRRRSQGLCEICRVRRAQEMIHLHTRHADGGGRELEDLGEACWDCHVLADAGVFRFSHLDAEGRPHWTDGEGREVREPPPPPYRARPFEPLAAFG